MKESFLKNHRLQIDKVNTLVHSKKRLLFLLFAFSFAVALGFLGYKNLIKTSAASTAGFKAGNIMSDYVMADYNSMNESDIQNFLKSKNSCNDTDLNKSSISRGYINAGTDYGVKYNYQMAFRKSDGSGNATYHYHVENGHFVCMADERFNGESAAHIIWQAAQDYRINPKVLIVLLQKEQALVTDTWPNTDIEYRSATGYGCPDTAACDSSYYGLKNQVREAAKFFRKNLDGDPNWTNYPVGWNNILYSPHCSTRGSVYVENRATGALYTYTPYQPTQAVLNAGYGTASGCSAYGNRNFYLYYTDWFGDTHGKELTGAYLPDGIYQFKSTGGLALSFDGTNNGASAIITTANSSDKLQQFKLSRTGKYYRFQNVATGRYLDVYNNEAYDGTKVELWDGNDGCAQKWLAQANGNGYRFISACSSEASTKSLDIYETIVSKPGTKVEIWETNSSDAQKWLLTNLESGNVQEGTYNFKSTGGKVLTSKTEYSSDGTEMIIWENSTSAASRFEIIKNTDGTYRIKQVSSNLYVTAKTAEYNDGVAVILSKMKDSCTQKWVAEKSGNGFLFHSVCTGKNLDISGGYVDKNNIKVQVWSSNSSNAQKWALSAVVTQPIKDGEYSINSALGNNLRLDVTGAAATNGANIQIWSRNGDNNQKFTLKYDSSTGYYTIYSTYSNRNLEATKNGAADGNVQINTINSSACYQKWLLLASGSNYKVVNSCARNVLDAANAKATAGTNVIVYSDNGGKNQLWQIDSNTKSLQIIADGTYYLESGVSSAMNLDVNGSAPPKSGTNVQIWHKNVTNSQKFKLTYNVSDNTYTLTNLFSNTPLDVTGAIAKNGINVEVWSRNSSCAQKWKISSTDNKYYRLASACNSNYSLDVNGAVSRAGTNVQVWSNNNTLAQKWKFNKI